MQSMRGIVAEAVERAENTGVYLSTMKATCTKLIKRCDQAIMAMTFVAGLNPVALKLKATKEQLTQSADELVKAHARRVAAAKRSPS